MKEQLTDFLNTINSPVIKAVIIFLFYVLLAKIADIFTDKVVRRLARISKSELDDSLIDLLHRPVFFTVIAIGAVHSIEILNVPKKFIFYSNGILYTILAVLWCVCIIKMSGLIIGKTITKVRDITGLSNELTPLIENIWTVLIIIGSTMFILSIWKIDITPLVASAGIVGVAVALAAKDTLANFFGGISIFVDKPYKIGDYIVLDGGERGEVVRIGIRSTRIKTRDDILISIPNSIIANTKIINESAPVPNFRIRVPVSVAYGTDIDKVENLLLDIADKNENVQDDPEPRVRFRTFGDSALNLELLCWTKEPAIRGRTIHEINKVIYNKFNSENITIPFPHRTVYLREEKNW
ncbi:MAG: mechanosensitive ion channel family protein [Nitrospirota bacterium]